MGASRCEPGRTAFPAPASILSFPDTDTSLLFALPCPFSHPCNNWPYAGERHFVESMVLWVGKPGPTQVSQFPHV